MMIFRIQNRKLQISVLKSRSASSTTSIIGIDDLEVATYNSKVVEGKKYEKWENGNKFKANNIFGNENFSMVLPPPNVTGKLHLGWFQLFLYLKEFLIFFTYL